VIHVRLMAGPSASFATRRWPRCAVEPQGAPRHRAGRCHARPCAARSLRPARPGARGERRRARRAGIEDAAIARWLDEIGR
jgi:hypothetical protein